MASVRRTGTRQQVFDGVALATKGGLTADDLQVNPKTGAIVSKRASEQAKARIAAQRADSAPAEPAAEAVEAPAPKAKKPRAPKRKAEDPAEE